jgi:hypothetical protein
MVANRFWTFINVQKPKTASALCKKNVKNRVVTIMLSFLKNVEKNCEHNFFHYFLKLFRRFLCKPTIYKNAYAKNAKNRRIF